jgi:hypothetical protein
MLRRVWEWIRGTDYSIEVWTDKGWEPFPEIPERFTSEGDAITEAVRVWLAPQNLNHTWRVKKHSP